MEDLEIHESCELSVQEAPCADIEHFSEKFPTQKTSQLVKLKSTLTNLKNTSTVHLFISLLAYTIQYGCTPELAIKGSAHVGSSSLVRVLPSATHPEIFFWECSTPKNLG